MKTKAVIETIEFVILLFALSWGGYLILKYFNVQSNTLLIALFYMSAPLVASIIIQSFVRKEKIRLNYLNLKSIDIKNLLAVALYFLIFVALNFLLISLLGNIFRIEPWGVINLSPENIRAVLISLTRDPNVPQLPDQIGIIILIAAIFGAVISGYSINLLFALGEEYGWRGFLLSRFAHLGLARANIIVGVIWSLWHVPLILDGLNYPNYPFSGMVLFTIYCIVLSTILSYVRYSSNSLLGSASLHGMINGIGPLMTLIVFKGNELYASVVGLSGLISASILLLIILFKDPTFFANFKIYFQNDTSSRETKI